MVSILLLLILSLPIVLISISIKVYSKGPIFYRQLRVTKYGKYFNIHKFRTMEVDADKGNVLLTTHNDCRVTRIGKFLRKYKLDEIPQLFDVLRGNMSFVGTRPEVYKYVCQYKPEYMATLLLPAGITSEASIRYKDENKLLKNVDNVDEIYMNEILPSKMKYNLDSIKNFSLINEFKTLVRTALLIFGKEYI